MLTIQPSSNQSKVHLAAVLISLVKKYLVIAAKTVIILFSFSIISISVSNIAGMLILIFRYDPMNNRSRKLIPNLKIDDAITLLSHLVAPRSTQPFIFPRSIKWVPGISGDLVVKGKLPPWSGCSLKAVEPHP